MAYNISERLVKYIVPHFCFHDRSFINETREK